MTKKPTPQLSFIFPFEDLVRKVERANRIPLVLKDLENIKQTLPILLPHQAENVYKTELRFFTPAENQLDGLNKGMMFTDGTGTGKTFVGLGIINRFKRMNLSDILIVVPTESICQVWRTDAKAFGINIIQLKDTKDSGAQGSIVVTTFANFRQNLKLVQRADKKPFDLVIYDEAHNLSSNQQGTSTEADIFHKNLTNAPDQAALKARAKYVTMSTQAKTYEEKKKVDELIKAETDRLIDATKVVFLSATPFSYHKSLQYADGYLFRIRQGMNGQARDSYNNFFIDNFRYRVRFNKLTEPDADVDVGLLERKFHTKLIKAGVVSSTRLRLDKDYSREFVLVDDKLGMLIDEGYTIASDANNYKYLSQVMKEKFNFLYKNQLLECIKARRVIERIEKHLALGRKIVVFHSYNNSLPSHPFDFSDELLYPKNESKSRVQADIMAFHTKYPQYKALDLKGLSNPIKTLTEAFGDRAVVFNGNVSAKDRAAVKSLFNKDDSGKDIMILQLAAGGAGISLHDTTGIKQRASINLALPYRPSDCCQSEGRTYRVGQKSDAVLEYPVLHLNFEKHAFGSKINDRIKTVENLAFGEGARNLKVAFKEGYINPIIDPPSMNQGKGSRDQDMVYDLIDAYEMAIKLYFNQGKRSAKDKVFESDYFSTPEPIGYKMVEWLYSQGNDHLLEPSAGHGAIARFFPDNTKNKLIEPSMNLRSDLAINAIGDLIPTTFEEFNIINKFNGIAMNPPFGASGKTAMDHMEKGCVHMHDNARMIIILPDGPAMNTRLEKWQRNPDNKYFFITGKIKLPAVTFSRAGTEVRTQLLVVDKIRDVNLQREVEGSDELDLTHIEDIKQLFEALKDVKMPARLRGVVQDAGHFGGVGERDSSTLAQVIPNKHTKFGFDLWTVRLFRKVSDENFKRMEARAKNMGGYYSSFTANGAIPGFIFKTPDPAKRLCEEFNNSDY